MFENRVVRKVFVDKTEDGEGEWRKLYQAELHVLCCSQHMRAITSRNNRWGNACDIYGGGEKYFRTEFWWGNMNERDPLEDLDVDWKIILKWILRKEDEVMWTGFVCFKKRTSRGLL